MKTRTYIITGTISFIVGSLITYAAFAFILLETNPLKWSRDARTVFVLFGWMIPVFTKFLSLAILKSFEDDEKEQENISND